MRRYENEPICGACNKKIELGMPITSLGDNVLHRWCYEALLRHEGGEVRRHGSAETR